ncbi:transposase [Holosporaceae bacterium 'Namur']|nr:transposase [Holosporaceae bacterium 'Namur']
MCSKARIAGNLAVTRIRAKLPDMSISESGIKSKIKSGEVNIKVAANHPLIKLGNVIEWEELKELVLPDIKASTKKSKWWLGRKLKLRIHLGAYMLQQLLNKTDRQIEYDIKDNAAYQIFCGKGIVEDWHCPDHTKIEEFRSRLSCETQRDLANKISVIAVKLGFARSSEMDIDSTVQKANIAYPSDVNLMVKLAEKANKVWKYMKSSISFYADWDIKVDVKNIKSKARRCFFSKIEDKHKVLQELWHSAYNEVGKVSRACECLLSYDIARMPRNIKRLYSQLEKYGRNYMLDVLSFILHKKIKADKVLSFHANEVQCFNKGNKRISFGRSIQLGRIKGNFIISCPHDRVRMEDRHSIELMIRTHEELFGEGILGSVAADKGYYSKANHEVLSSSGIKEIGLQKPGRNSIPQSPNANEIESKLTNRRAGIEPLIGHMKNKWQLGRSKMKSDTTTLSAAFASMLGFNVHQLMRYASGRAKLAT